MTQDGTSTGESQLALASLWTQGKGGRPLAKKCPRLLDIKDVGFT